MVNTHSAPIEILMRPHQCPERQTEAGPQMRLSVSPLSWVIVIKWGRHVLLCRPLGSDESWYSWNNTAPTTIGLARHLVGLSKVVLSLKCWSWKVFNHILTFGRIGHRGIGWRLVWGHRVVLREYQEYRNYIGDHNITILVGTLLNSLDGGSVRKVLGIVTRIGGLKRKTAWLLAPWRIVEAGKIVVYAKSRAAQLQQHSGESWSFCKDSTSLFGSRKLFWISLSWFLKFFSNFS